MPASGRSPAGHRGGGASPMRSTDSSGSRLMAAPLRVRVPFRERAHGGDDETRLRAGLLEDRAPSSRAMRPPPRLCRRRIAGAPARRRDDAENWCADAPSAHRRIDRCRRSCPAIPQSECRRWRDNRSLRPAMAAARMSTPTRWRLPLRSRQISAAASAGGGNACLQRAADRERRGQNRLRAGQIDAGERRGVVAAVGPELRQHIARSDHAARSSLEATVESALSR